MSYNLEIKTMRDQSDNNVKKSLNGPKVYAQSMSTIIYSELELRNLHRKPLITRKLTILFDQLSWNVQTSIVISSQPAMQMIQLNKYLAHNSRLKKSTRACALEKLTRLRLVIQISTLVLWNSCMHIINHHVTLLVESNYI